MIYNTAQSQGYSFLIFHTRAVFAILAIAVFLAGTVVVLASAPEAGGDTTVVNPTGEVAVSITENAPEPEQPNIRLIVPNLTDPAGGTPASIRIISITGGTMKDGGGGNITLGTSGTVLSLSSSRVDLRFKPTANWDTPASFQYVVVDPHDAAVNSAASTATIPITAVNNPPTMKTQSGPTGIGLAATYFINNWDLTGPTYVRIDPTVNFNGLGQFNVPGISAENFSVRWTGQIKAPVDGDYRFVTSTDDGIRLWVDGDLIIDNWTVHGTTTDYSPYVSFTADSVHDIEINFYERGGGEVMIFQWEYPGFSGVVPQSQLFPATIRPAINYITGSGAINIDDGITISDVDSTMISSATITISSNYQAGEDSLQFTNQNGITGTYLNGVLTLTGTASLANYQAALRSVKYANSSGSPNTATRTVSFIINDGEDDSNYTYRSLEFGGTNTPPEITEGDDIDVTMDEDSSPTAFDLTLNASDADYHSITWSIGTQASNGTATASGSGDSMVITYVPNSNFEGSDSFVVEISDGSGGTDSITVNVTVDPQNDEPYPLVNPSLAGTGYIDSSHTLGRGTWSDDHDQTPGNLIYNYQWQVANDNSGNGLSDISGATGLTFTPGSSYLGKFLRVKVTVSDDGTGEPASQSGIAYTSYLEITAPPQVTTSNPPVTPTPAPSVDTNTNSPKKSTANNPADPIVEEETSTELSPIFTSAPIEFVGITKVDEKVYSSVNLNITTRNQNPPISGTAPPGSTIMITIMSKSITGIVIADNNGNWSWTPQENLEFGEHQVEVQITDPSGKKYSEKFKLTIENDFVPGQSEGISGFICAICPLLFLIGICLFFIFWKRREKEEEKDQRKKKLTYSKKKSAR